VVVLVLVPGAIATLIGGKVGATTFAVGLLVGLLGALSTGTGPTTRVLPLFAVAAVAGGLTAGTWWWAAVAAAFAALGGWSARWGLVRLFAFVALVAVVTPAVTAVRDVVAAVVFVLLGVTLGIQVAGRAGAPEDLDRVTVPPRHAALSAVGMALAIFAACAAALAWGNERGFWIPMTVLVLAPPVAGGRGRRSGQRLLGTVIGFAALIPLAALHPDVLVAHLLGVVFVVLTLVWMHPYWVQMTCATLALVMLLAPAGHELDVAGDRLLATAIGAGILLAIVGLGQLFLGRPDDPLEIPADPVGAPSGLG
jgi:hypothetical protein